VENIQKQECLKILSGDFSYDMFHEQPNLPEMVSIIEGKEVVMQPESINRKHTNSFLKKNLEGLRKNVFVLSDDFQKAIRLSTPSFAKILRENSDYVFQNLKYTTGVYITQDVSNYYHIDLKNQTISFCVFQNNNLVYALQNLDVSSLKQKNITKITLGIYIPGYTPPTIWNSLINAIIVVAYDIFNICLFRTFADHELKVVSRKSTGKINNMVYRNMNKTDVAVLDSSWYTSIVRTEGFVVRGHMKMQPCGPNLSERKLIYVDSFEKYGYVRKAKMLPTQTPSISEIINA
jgi:hypothetical protein